MMRRLLTVSPDTEPLWVRLYARLYGNHWVAMIVGDSAPTQSGDSDGLGVFRRNAGRRGAGGQGVSGIVGTGELSVSAAHHPPSAWSRQDLCERGGAPIECAPHGNRDPMPDERERRTVPRIRLPDRPTARVRGVQEVRLLDLSVAGAQIRHLAVLRLGAACALELLPPSEAYTLPA